jgi:hypothetical protein
MTAAAAHPVLISIRSALYTAVFSYCANPGGGGVADSAFSWCSFQHYPMNSSGCALIRLTLYIAMLFGRLILPFPASLQLPVIHHQSIMSGHYIRHCTCLCNSSNRRNSSVSKHGQVRWAFGGPAIKYPFELLQAFMNVRRASSVCLFIVSV